MDNMSDLHRYSTNTIPPPLLVKLPVCHQWSNYVSVWDGVRIYTTILSLVVIGVNIFCLFSHKVQIILDVSGICSIFILMMVKELR